MTSSNPYAAPASAPDTTEAVANARTHATVALVLAGLAIFVLAPVLAPIAIVMAHRAGKVDPSWQGTATLVLAALALASSALFWFLFVWQLLAP